MLLINTSSLSYLLDSIHISTWKWKLLKVPALACFRDDILIELLSDLLSYLIHVGTEISASGCAVLLPYSLAFF